MMYITPKCIFLEDETSDVVHNFPVGDLRLHVISPTCWCKPVLNEQGAYDHNAMDRRQDYISGKIKLH